MQIKKLKVTRERFEKSRYFKKKYGGLKYVSESGRTFKTANGTVVRFVSEAREYVDDDSIDVDSAEEFIIFDDPNIFEQIAKAQEKKEEEIQDEVKSGEVNPNEIAKSAENAAKIGAGAQVTAAAINTVGNIATSKLAMGLAAAAGYKKVLDKAGEVGDAAGWKVGGAYSDLMGYNDNMDAGEIAKKKYDDMVSKMGQKFADYAKVSNLGAGNVSQVALQNDKRAMAIADALQNGQPILSGNGGKDTMSNQEAKEWLSSHGYEIKDGVANRTTSWVDPKAVATAGASTAAGAAASAGVGAAASGTGSGAAASAGTWLGMSAATIGWVLAGVAAAAIITPYIYDKVRACTKTWMADIIAEVKFKADGKAYRCFYDLDENKWVLTYANIKWTSYLDNKLDKETIEEFFASKFFANFLAKCRKTFALLFSTGKNEVVFKTLPEIKDAPKELKGILEKIYDNKGAITKNLFTGNH